MNDLTATYNAIAAQSDSVNKAKQIYAVCRTITPAFYAKQTAQEIQLCVASIELTIRNIRSDILAKMCELAVENYGRARARDSRVFFDVNYILTFYNEAWDRARPRNMSWIVSVELEDGKWVVTYCDDDDIDDNGKLKDGAQVWRDER